MEFTCENLQSQWSVVCGEVWPGLWFLHVFYPQIDRFSLQIFLETTETRDVDTSGVGICQEPLTYSLNVDSLEMAMQREREREKKKTD